MQSQNSHPPLEPGSQDWEAKHVAEKNILSKATFSGSISPYGENAGKENHSIAMHNMC